MKHRSTELNVDSIGGLGSLTKEDERAISDFIRARRLKRQAKRTQRRLIARKKIRKSEGKK